MNERGRTWAWEVIDDADRRAHTCMGLVSVRALGPISKGEERLEQWVDSDSLGVSVNWGGESPDTIQSSAINFTHTYNY